MGVFLFVDYCFYRLFFCYGVGLNVANKQQNAIGGTRLLAYAGFFRQNRRNLSTVAISDSYHCHCHEICNQAAGTQN